MNRNRATRNRGNKIDRADWEFQQVAEDISTVALAIAVIVFLIVCLASG